MSFDANYQKLARDLRDTQYEILDEVLKRVAVCRINRDFEGWYYGLEDLYIEIDKKLLKKERGAYTKQLSKCNKVLNDYSAEYLQQSKDDNNCNLVKEALVALELWLKRKMEKHKMFGSSGAIEGL